MALLGAQDQIYIVLDRLRAWVDGRAGRQAEGEIHVHVYTYIYPKNSRIPQQKGRAHSLSLVVFSLYPGQKMHNVLLA